MPLERRHLSAELLGDPAGWTEADRRHVETCPTCRATARLMGWRPEPTGDGLRLGAFVLESELGQGGMGAIWRARSTLTGVAAAIKVVRPDRMSAENRRLFEQEIATVASLDHRHIVNVLDVGEVGATVGSGMPEGSLWFAMEFLSAGSLESLRVAEWRVLERVLASTLLALGHAHARGVVHRDLKPANLCIGAAADSRPGLKLCDFGIAVAAGERARTAGTAPYMAPELYRQDRPGPWNDLYALGVMGWALAARALPFVGVTGEMQAAKRQGLPPLRGVVDLPETYLEWLRWLAEPSPVQRPQSAQEALAALRALGPPVPTLASAGIAEGFSDVLTWNTLAVVDTEPMARVRAEDPPSPDVPSRRARLPEDWRRGSLRDPPLKLRGAGLGLLAWRDPELVGHVAARDALWRHAREPIAPVRVRGLAGVGKSAVGRWLVRTVRSWGGFGFTCDASSQRDALWLAMTQIAAAVCEAPAPEASWTNARLEASVREWLAAVSSRAATVVHLDATGPGSDLLAALCAGLSEPVSVVWTVGSAPARPIDLELLPVAKLAEILTRYAGVEAASAVRLANAANGLPGVALDQMRAAITREAFRWASTGLVIDRVPPRPQRSWGIRMDEAQLLDLQCAAAIGVDVPAALWEPLCQSGASWAAVRGLARQGLAALTATGFRFLDAGLREWLLVRAGADRSDLHRAVLRVVEERYDGPDRDLWRARQLTELGRMDEAYPCWKEAFWLRRQEDGCHALAVLVFELQAMMDRVGLPASDPRRGMLRATLIQGWRTGGEQEACLREVESLLQDPHAALWPLAVAKGLLERARANLFADLEMAWAELQEAEGLLDGVSPDDDEARLSCVDVREHRLWLRYDRARLLGLRGEPQARLDALRALCADAALSSCAEIEADACCELAMDLLASEPEEAWSWAVRAREVNEGLGRMLGAADAWSVSGHVARRLGQVDRATEAYRTSIAMHQELESAFGIFPCLGLARLQLEQGALSEAAESIRRGMIVGRDLGPSLRGYALCLQAICDVRLGDLDAALSGFETVAEIRERHEVAISELTDVLLAIRADEDAVLLHPILDVLLAAPSGP